jgi:hypothetical protein
MFETLAERTLAPARSSGDAIRRADTARRSSACCRSAGPVPANGIRIIGNFGGANRRPAAASELARAAASRCPHRGDRGR